MKQHPNYIIKNTVEQNDCFYDSFNLYDGTFRFAKYALRFLSSYFTPDPNKLFKLFNDDLLFLIIKPVCSLHYNIYLHRLTR